MNGKTDQTMPEIPTLAAVQSCWNEPLSASAGQMHSAIGRYFSRYRQPGEGASILVALSGGPDSVMLLSALLGLGIEHGWRIGAAHVNYGLRGDESEDDHRFCRTLCRRWKVRFHSARRMVPKPAGTLNLQAWARTARYGFLEDVSDQHGYTAIAVGHHLDDRAESVAGAVLDAAGTFALSGIPPVRNRVIRPLFDCSRDDILAYLMEMQIPYRHDSSNRGVQYRRNRIRNQVLPEWEVANPQIVPGLARLGEQLWYQRRFLEEMAGSVVDKALMERKSGRLTLAADALSRYDRCLDPFVLRNVIERVGLTIVPAPATTSQFFQVRQSECRGEVRVEQGELVIIRSKKMIAIERRKEHRPAPPVRVPIAGSSALVFGSIRVKAEVVGATTAGPYDDSVEAWLDLDCLDGALQLRSPVAGDRYRPVGLKGSKKLTDILADRGVPSYERPEVAVLGDRKGILWPIGHPIAERARVTTKTQQSLHVQVVNP